MGGGKSGPKAPDPYATANAQLGMNTNTARLQARLNRSDTVTPFGSITQREGSGWDEAAYLAANPDVAEAVGRGAFGSGQDHYARHGINEGRSGVAQGYDPSRRDQWVTTMTLSPEQQRLYDQGVQFDTQTGQLALDMLPEARRALMAPMAMDDPDARDRATAGFMSRMEPQFERDRAALEGRLLAQGFQPGTEAYRQAADELSRARTDARMQAITAGLNESRAGAAFNNATRGQRISELGMVFGLGPGMQMPQQIQQQPVQMQTPDLAGLLQQQYQQRVAQQGSNMGAFAGLGGAALGSIFGGGAGAAGGASLGNRIGNWVGDRFGL